MNVFWLMVAESIALVNVTEMLLDISTFCAAFSGLTEAIESNSGAPLALPVTLPVGETHAATNTMSNNANIVPIYFFSPDIHIPHVADNCLNPCEILQK